MPLDHEDLEELVRRVISEERSESLAHPGQRAKVTSYTDPEGKTWVSRTMSKVEEFWRLALLVGSICAFFGGVLTGYYKYVLLPDVLARSRVMIAEHSSDATARMNEVAKSIVTKAEFGQLLRDSAWVADKERRWEAQQEINLRLESAMLEIQKDIKELLRRR